MPPASTDMLGLVFARLAAVRSELGLEPLPRDDAAMLLADAVDSMGLVELLAILAEDRGVRPEAIEKAAGHRFTTVASLALAMEHAASAVEPAEGHSHSAAAGFLSSPALVLPRTVESTHDLDRRLNRPPGWLEAHAGIARRHVWAGEDALEGAVSAARSALEAVGLLPEEVGALLVTSQAPPLLAGLGAVLHHRLGLPPRAVALEIGGACTGFLQALWTGSHLLTRLETALILAVEAPSLHLAVEPGDAGEAAALFGDAAAACVLSRTAFGDTALSLVDITLGVDGSGCDLLGVAGTGKQGVRVKMDGPRLAGRAIEALAEGIRQAAGRHGLEPGALAGVIVHGGNGRMPGMVARRLGMAEDRVWSTTAETGNLGSASLPAAWSRVMAVSGPIAWAAVGAGLTFASALTVPAGERRGVSPPSP